MDYRKCAQEIFQHVGGRENLVSAAHCATRLRLVIADNSKLDMKALEQVDGVKGVFSNAGQLQLILGTGTVNKVYDEFLAVSRHDRRHQGGGQGGRGRPAASAQADGQGTGRRVRADSALPSWPPASSWACWRACEGLARSGQLGHLHYFPSLQQRGLCLPAHSGGGFRRPGVGGNIFLGAVIGMIMIHTDLINAWSVADYVANGTPIPTAEVWFGLYDINLTGYQGHVLPVIIAVWIMCQIEKRLHKIVPEMLDLFITPLVTVCATGYLTLTIFGPVFSTVENWVLAGVQMLITIPFGIGAAIMGAIYPHRGVRRAPHV